MNIVEAYRKAIKCGGKITGIAGKYSIDKVGDIVTEFGSKCYLGEGWLTQDTFDVIEPPKQKYNFAEAWKMMEQGKIMFFPNMFQYKILLGHLHRASLKKDDWLTSTITREMVNSNTWEIYDG